MAQKLAINWYYISTHAPRTGSDCYKWYRKHYSCSISTHAPRTGSDAFHQLLPADVEVIFQPTLPARGATMGIGDIIHARRKISTHAPRTGSDDDSDITQ